MCGVLQQADDLLIDRVKENPIEPVGDSISHQWDRILLIELTTTSRKSTKYNRSSQDFGGHGKGTKMSEGCYL